MLKLRILLCLMAVLALLLSCANGLSVHTDKPAPAVDVAAQVVAPREISLPSIEELDRQNSVFDTGLMKSASKYVPTYGRNITSIDEDVVQFSPNWDGTANRELSYCIYKFDLTGYTGASKVSFTWASNPKKYQNCWVGVSYWPKTIWEWYQPKWGQTNSISLKSYNDYKNSSSGSMFIAIVLTGTQTAQLKYIQAGTNLDPVAMLKADKTEGGILFRLNLTPADLLIPTVALPNIVGIWTVTARSRQNPPSRQ